MFSTTVVHVCQRCGSERMAYIARSMTDAVGQRGDVGGPVNTALTFDLEPYVGDNHSGEWELPLQQVYLEYNKLIDAIGLAPNIN